MKERLTGAIILVALIVLLVPELLTGPIRTRSARTAVLTVTLPPAAPTGRTERTEPPLRTYSLTLGGLQPVPATPGTPAAQAPTWPAEGSSDKIAGSDFGRQMPAPKGRGPGGAEQSHAEQPSGPQQGAAAGSGGLQLSKSAPSSGVREARSSGSSGGWVVQLGSFASRQNADRLARSLRGKGFRMSVSPARAGSRVLWRVRAGPAHDRAGALHLATRLKALGHRGELLPVR